MIAIIGAGLSGLSIGWYLARAGCQVTVIDRGKAGQGASWAAAGMLAPQVEAEPGEESLLALALASRAIWPDFAAALEAASGRGVDYRDEGTLVVALDRDDAERLAFQHDYFLGQGLEISWLSGRELQRREPHLSRRVTAGVFSPLDHQVDNRKVVVALKAAFLAAGGKLIEDCRVTSLLTAAGRVSGLATATGEIATEIATDCVVLAAGAWSREIEGIPDHLRPPVRPVKGQMAAVQMPPEAPLLRHVVWIPEGYLVPRLDGRLIIGGTVEEMGFDDRLTAGGIMEVLRNAWEALPGIYDLPLVETWCGFRPTSRDDAPIFGPTELPGLVMATGHHRQGVLLAPITAEAISAFILTGSLPEAARPFTLDRFSVPPTNGALAI
jgi:glycine oxidase